MDGVLNMVADISKRPIEVKAVVEAPKPRKKSYHVEVSRTHDGFIDSMDIEERIDG